MDLKVSKDELDLIWNTLVLGKTGVEKIPFYPQKTRSPRVEEEPAAFARISPAEVGIAPERVTALLRALSEKRDSAVHSVLLLVDGKCIAEASAPGYSTRLPHMTFSLCKSVTGMAVGMLVDDGKLRLTDKVCDILAEEVPKLAAARFRAVTVRDLLTMAVGVGFNEGGAVVTGDWIRGYAESAEKFAPGHGFAYNSMSSFLLSAIVCKITGRSLSDFLTERLWKPLGITDAFWEVNPKGIEKGGWGLYLSPQSMAKLGQTYLQGGVWEGKRILSEEWVKESTTAKNAVPDKIGPFDYGYQLWVHKKGEGFLFNGMMGQNVWVLPRLSLVAVLTAGDSDNFQNGPSLRMTLDTFTPVAARGAKRKETRRDRESLRQAEENFKKNDGIFGVPDRQTSAAAHAALKDAGLFGRWYLPKSNASLLPLLNRLIQNNHAAAIRSLTLTEENGEVTLSVRESRDENILRVGEGTPAIGQVSLRGESFRVAVRGEWGYDEWRLPIYKVEVAFTELTGVRIFIFRQNAQGKLILSLRETPGYAFIESLLSVSEMPAILENALAKDTLVKAAFFLKVQNTFAPDLPLSREPFPANEEAPETLPGKPAKKDNGKTNAKSQRNDKRKK